MASSGGSTSGNPVFERGMQEVVPAVIGLIGWKDNDTSAAGGGGGSQRVFEAHRLTATKRCGHFAVQIIREEDNTPVIPDVETSADIIIGLDVIWSQRGKQNMGRPWSSINFLFRSDGKIQTNFEGEQQTTVEAEEDSYVKTIHDAREKLYETLYCGTFPKTIVKLNHLFGVWGMGGLVDFKATNPNIGGNYHVHSSFGLSNPDMPALFAATNLNNVKPGTSGALLSPKKQRPLPRVGMAGYGYELLIITKEQEDWSKFLMQWAVDKEIQSDVNFLAHVEGAGGLTVENVPVGGQPGNILIAPAQDPWPQSGMLPNGMVKFFIMTIITTEEMKFAMKEGRIALLRRLREQKIWQVSDLSRIASA